VVSNDGSSGRSRRASARRGWRLTVAALAAVSALTVAACGSSSSSGSGSSGGKRVKVALILKTFSNPYFVWMEKSA